MTNSDDLNQSGSGEINSPSFINSSSLISNTNSNSNSNVSTSSANINFNSNNLNNHNLSNSFSVLSQSQNSIQPNHLNHNSQLSTSPLQLPQQSQSSAKHPLSNCKHLCSICGDRSSGKHYGTFSCEGCKGFFKRTVRKDLTYACREDRNCMIDKRQRNRCQYCRYNKCLMMGMKREAVQEERQRNKEKNENQVESSTTCNSLFLEMPASAILQAENKVELNTDQFDTEDISDVNQAVTRQLYNLIEWAKNIPYFNSLSLDDQVILLKAAWNELLISSLAHRSIHAKDSILLANGLVVRRHSAAQVGVGCIFDRVLSELVSKMKQLNVDKTELGCLRCIVLYNPEAKGLKNVEKVEQIRESVYVSLENYTKNTYPDQSGRFAKLLLRLPALRSVALKCVEHLFFYKLNEAVKRENSISNSPMTVDSFLISMLERSNNTIDL